MVRSIHHTVPSLRRRSSPNERQRSLGKHCTGGGFWLGGRGGARGRTIDLKGMLTSSPSGRQPLHQPRGRGSGGGCRPSIFHAPMTNGFRGETTKTPRNRAGPWERRRPPEEDRSFLSVAIASDTHFPAMFCLLPPPLALLRGPLTRQQRLICSRLIISGSPSDFRPQ